MNSMNGWALEQFVVESWEIEDLWLSKGELAMQVALHADFLEVQEINVEYMKATVLGIQPGARLRDKVGLDVMVGNHVPPPGGREIAVELQTLLAYLGTGGGWWWWNCPYMVHQKYEALHPFTDGNGRSGRLLWLWQMVNRLKYNGELGFLHKWYYQSLENQRKVDSNG